MRRRETRVVGPDRQRAQVQVRVEEVVVLGEEAAGEVVAVAINAIRTA